MINRLPNRVVSIHWHGIHMKVGGRGGLSAGLLLLGASRLLVPVSCFTDGLSLGGEGLGGVVPALLLPCAALCLLLRCASACLLACSLVCEGHAGAASPTRPAPPYCPVLQGTPWADGTAMVNR